jgi:hypothetical protein
MTCPDKVFINSYTDITFTISAEDVAAGGSPSFQVSDISELSITLTLAGVAPVTKTWGAGQISDNGNETVNLSLEPADITTSGTYVVTGVLTDTSAKTRTLVMCPNIISFHDD